LKPNAVLKFLSAVEAVTEAELSCEQVAELEMQERPFFFTFS
jgi:hypothetical protein